jgi:hypothetical protein
VAHLHNRKRSNEVISLGVALLALFSHVASAAGVVTMSGPQLIVPAPPTTSPYAQYPALDLNTIPFHTGSGAWGAQLAIQQPAMPTITSSARVASDSQLQACMAVAGRRCTITANIVPVTVTNATDNEVVLPNGFLGTEVNFGGTIKRLRITKASGDTIGGQIHKLGITATTWSDLIIDGIQMSGDTSGGGMALYIGSPGDRAAIVNNRFKSETAVFGYGGRHIVVAGNSAQHDSNSTVNGGDWGFRQGSGTGQYGPYVYYQNDIRGAYYAPIRFHPVPANTTPYYAWVKSSNFVSTECRFVEMHGLGAEDDAYPPPDGGWILDNTLTCPTNPGTVGMAMDQAGVYTRVNGNVIYGATTGLRAGSASNGNSTGNTYTGTTPGLPAWAGAGDPTGIDTTP